jgi:transposase
VILLFKLTHHGREITSPNGPLWLSIVSSKSMRNHAERVLRKAVLWRKKSFGCVSEGGGRFVERILTVVRTLRLQRRSAWQFLQQSLHAYRSHQPAPRLTQG